MHHIQMISEPVFSISLFSTALWDLLNSRPVHSLMLSSHLFLCLPCLLPPFTVSYKMVLSKGQKISWFNRFLLYCCTHLEKEDYLENLNVLSCFVWWKSDLFISCVFWMVLARPDERETLPSFIRGKSHHSDLSFKLGSALSWQSVELLIVLHLW